MNAQRKVFGITLLSILLFLVAGFGVLLGQDGTSAEPTIQDTGVYRFSDNSQVDDAFARVTRFDSGVTMAISTNDLQAGDVFTVWWVVFNSPENCSNGVCNGDDILLIEDGVVPRDELGNRVMNMEAAEAANVSVIHASGGFAKDGTLHTSASLGEGNVPGIVMGPGLLDAETAEIHLVLRTHGPANEAFFAEQLSTFGGGCEPADALPCDDVQYAVFKPS